MLDKEIMNISVTTVLTIIQSEQFDIICKSPYHRQELLSWLSEIKEPSNNTTVELIKHDTKAQAAVATVKK